MNDRRTDRLIPSPEIRQSLVCWGARAVGLSEPRVGLEDGEGLKSLLSLGEDEACPPEKGGPASSPQALSSVRRRNKAAKEVSWCSDSFITQMCILIIRI